MSTDTDAQTGVRTYKLKRAMEEGTELDRWGMASQFSAEVELYALAMDAERENAE